MPQLFDIHSEPFNPENPSLDYASPTQSVTAVTDTLTPTGGLLKFTSDGAHTLTSTPTVATANAKAGDILTMLNVGAHAVTVSRGAGTHLKLGAATRAVGEMGTLRLLFDGTDWVELSFLATATV